MADPQTPAPYPVQWERTLVLRDGSPIFVRPIRPDDEEQIKWLLEHTSKQDLRFRFFTTVKVFSHEFLVALTTLDYARAMAFVAFEKPDDEILGVVRLHHDDAHRSGEFAILLRSDSKGRGLGWALMNLMIEYGRSEGLKQITGQIFGENRPMIAMCRELGFRIRANPEERDIYEATLALTDSPPA